MRVGLRTWFIGPLVVLALALGGCNSDRVTAENKYVDATNRVVQAFEDRFMALQADFTSTSTPAQDRATLRTLKAAVDRSIVDLGAVQAPADVAALHARLIAQVRDYAAEILAARSTFASSDPRRILTARARFSDRLTVITTRITSTIDAINQRLK